MVGGVPLAAPIPGLLPVEDARGPVRALIASLVPGGAERIVLEWLGAEAARGREVELAVLHSRANALAVPRGIRVRARAGLEPVAFVEALADAWHVIPACVSAHLVPDELLERLWAHGIATIPVVHNAPAGWRNDPRRWRAPLVPTAIACAASVREALLAAGCGVPVQVIRHAPGVGRDAFDHAVRVAMRSQLGVAPGTFLVGAVGALKAQKDYPRAIDALARLCRGRDAALAIVGGVLDRDGLAQLDALVDRAVRLGVADRLRLPGFAPRIEPYLAAFDAFLNVSRFEGLSMATREALAAGLPVIATDVGGQGELAHAALTLLPADAGAETFARALAAHPVRATLTRVPQRRMPREWSVPLAARAAPRPRLDTLFVTANLNAGGAQRSLVNLAAALSGRHAFAIAVCGESTHGAFVHALRTAGVNGFRPAPDADPCALAESILAKAAASRARSVCLWNVDAKLKILLAKFAPATLRLLDVSPGAYAFEELSACESFAESVGFSVERYERRLDVLVVKYAGGARGSHARVETIPNGVATRALEWRAPAAPRFLVSGRIAPSKRLEVVVEAFRRVARKHPAAALDFLGVAEPRHRAYARAIESLCAGLEARFRGEGFDLAHLDEAFTATVVLGVHQGCPNAVLEAMGAGIPVIANASGGTADLLEHGGAGWLLPEECDAAAVAAAMCEAIAAPQRARARAERAHANVRERHSLQGMAARYLALLAPETVPEREQIPAWIPPGIRPA